MKVCHQWICNVQCERHPQILASGSVGNQVWYLFTQLAQDVIAQPPVQWIPPIDAETAIQYLHRVQEAGKEKDVA